MRPRYCECLVKSCRRTPGLVDLAFRMTELMGDMAWDGKWKPFFEFVKVVIIFRCWDMVVCERSV